MLQVRYSWVPRRPFPEIRVHLPHFARAATASHICAARGSIESPSLKAIRASSASAMRNKRKPRPPRFAGSGLILAKDKSEPERAFMLGICTTCTTNCAFPNLDRRVEIACAHIRIIYLRIYAPRAALAATVRINQFRNARDAESERQQHSRGLRRPFEYRWPFRRYI